ncbi:MAG: glycosyltransferase family 4 protein [Planctomycetes bacterium]|nr:glycosyltransferase family 4 protein [Planctomycetota bacterium]
MSRLVAVPLLLAAKIGARIPGALAAQRTDLVWLQREMVSRLITLEPLLRRPMVFDVDDAIWLRNPFAAAIARRADLVIAGNHYLAEWFSRHGSNVAVVPTAVDTAVVASRAPGDRGPGSLLRVGWLGSRGNLIYLRGIAPALSRFLREWPGARVAVLCDERPELPGVPTDRLDFVQWRPDLEARFLSSIDVGLMPLRDGPWERGKCSFKLLQYMAAGIPAIASPVGMNVEVAVRGGVLSATTEAEWLDALGALAKDDGLRHRLGQAGRCVVETNYSVEVVSRQLAELLRAAAAGRRSGA